MLIHPDLLYNSSLARKIKQYEYFNHSVHEALFLSDKEETIIESILHNIVQECEANIDKFSQPVMLAQLDLLLND